MSWVLSGAAVVGFAFVLWQRRGNPIVFGFDYGRFGLVAMAVFCVLIQVGSGPIAAGVAAVALATGTFLGYRAAVSRVGVESLVFTRATSLAFFVTIVVAAAYGIFEVLADAPRISMMHVWSVGVVVWVGATAVFNRRLT